MPGNLKCKAVAHAVGPHWSGGKKGEEKVLKDTVHKCLHKTEKANFTSVAMPAISAGIFSYPVDKSCKHIVEALDTHFKVKIMYFFYVKDFRVIKQNRSQS